MEFGRKGEIDIEYYDIILEGHLNKKRLLMFAEMEVTLLEDGTTKLSGFLDQPALYGFLDYVGNLGLKLISVKKIKKENQGGIKK